MLPSLPVSILNFTYTSPLSLTAKCLDLPILSATTNAPKPSGKNNPPLSRSAFVVSCFIGSLIVSF